MTIKTNLKKIIAQRKEVKVGDIFILNILDDKYHWGRVVSKSADSGGFPNCTLIYIYDITSTSYNEIPELKKENLLVPPITTNDLAWRKGLFYTVENQKLSPEDTFKVHCFEDVVFKKYFDEHKNELPERLEPCGYYVLKSYRTIDDQLSEKLGIPLIPE